MNDLDHTNPPFFRLHVASHVRPLTVLSFTGSEAINRPFVFELNIISEDVDLDLQSLMFEPAYLSLRGSTQVFHGQVQKAGCSRVDEQYAYYQIIIGPRLACLSERFSQRVFQHMTAQDIIIRVLNEHNIGDDAYLFDLKKTCAPRDYCAQYCESDLQLVQRLCEEEGIHYHYRHSCDQHVLVFGDGAHSFDHGLDVTFEESLMFPGVTRLAVNEGESGQPVKRAQREGEGESNEPCLLSGHSLALTGHVKADLNHRWLIESVQHWGFESTTVYASPGISSALPYYNYFAAVPAEVGYRGAAASTARRMPEFQRAWVVSLESDHLHDEEEMRVKVQFDWANQGQGSLHAECWAPVDPALLDEGVELKVGMQVVVIYPDGNARRPLVKGILQSNEPSSSKAPMGNVVQLRPAASRFQAQLDCPAVQGATLALGEGEGLQLTFEENSHLQVNVGDSSVVSDGDGLQLASPNITFVSPD